ncbi:polysaccharide deacetylase family protein [Flavobacteriales bacterium]|nr:polysaccharide deacetylase family protein [Flavobacteriales bacterium]
MKSLPIAMLHHVENRKDWDSLQPYSIKRKTLVQLLDQIERSGKKGVSLIDALETPSRKKVVLTFDDGAQHLWDFAIPALLNRGMTASFYIPTHHIGKTNSWDVEEGRAEVQLMDGSAIRELHKVGMEIGGHSHHHIRLGEVEESRAIKELRMSKEILDDLIQKETQSMAWPYGSVPENSAELLKQCGWKSGLAIFSPDTHPARMRRFIIHDGDTSQSMRLKFGPLYRAYRSVMDRRMSPTSSRN